MTKKLLFLSVAAVAAVVISLPGAYATGTGLDTEIAFDRPATELALGLHVLDQAAPAVRPSAPQRAEGKSAIAQAFTARVLERSLPRTSSPALVTADRESIGYHPRL